MNYKGEVQCQFCAVPVKSQKTCETLSVKETRWLLRV